MKNRSSTTAPLTISTYSSSVVEPSSECTNRFRDEVFRRLREDRDARFRRFFFFGGVVFFFLGTVFLRLFRGGSGGFSSFSSFSSSVVGFRRLRRFLRGGGDCASGVSTSLVSTSSSLSVSLLLNMDSVAVDFFLPFRCLVGWGGRGRRLGATACVGGGGGRGRRLGATGCLGGWGGRGRRLGATACLGGWGGRGRRLGATGGVVGSSWPGRGLSVAMTGGILG